jgi:SH3-like domain-containing protein
MIRSLRVAPLLLALLLPPDAAGQTGSNLGGGADTLPPPRPAAAPPATTPPARSATTPPAPPATTPPPRPAMAPPSRPATPPAQSGAAAPARPATQAPARPPRPATQQTSQPRQQPGQRPPVPAAAGVAAGAAAGAAAAGAAAAPPPPTPPAPPEPPPPSTGQVSGLPIPRFAALRSNEVNLRAGPDTRFPIEWSYQRRDLPVMIVGEHLLWRRVRDMDGIEGWVHQATLAGRRTFLVQGQERTLRARADDASAAVAVLRPGVVGRIRRCEATAAWCEVQAGDHRGWLRREGLWGIAAGEAVN